MKWNNRLKSVLTNPEESVFSEDCLETQVTKGDKTHLKLVSSPFVTAHSRQSSENLTNSDTGKKELKLVSSPFVTAHSRQSSENNDELSDFKAGKLHDVLNRFIENGITFDVSADDFQFIDSNQTLKASDREFLELNSAEILCNLQQSLLMKHLFNHSPERFEDFAFEITEREAINSEECLNTQVTKGDKTRFEIYFQAVKSTTRKWFDELLKEKDIARAASTNKNVSMMLH
jgi:CBS-domain-containing membrane protein